MSTSQPRSFNTILRDHPALLIWLALLAGAAAGASVSLGPVWLGFAALLALLGGLAILRSTDLGLLMVLAAALLLPFGALPFKIAITPTFLELALLAFGATVLLRLLADPDTGIRFSSLGGLLFAWLGLTVFALVLGAGGLPDNLTLHNYVKFVLGVLLFFGVLNAVRTLEQARMALRWLIAGGAAAAALGIGLYALNDVLALQLLSALGRLGYPTSGRVLRYAEDDPSGLERAIGTAVDPNSFGGAIALVCAIGAAQLWVRRPVLPRPLLAAGVATMALCVFLTYSRAALGGLLVAAVFLAIVRERRLWYVLGAAAVVGAVAVFGLGLGGAFVDRVVEGVQFRDQANQMRLAEFRNAVEIIRRYPVFGVGFGAAPELGLVTGVSSIYLAMGQRIGLLGLGLFGAIMAMFFVLTLRALPRLDEDRAAMLIGIQAGVLAALAVGLLDHYFFNIGFSHMAALLWACVGLGMVIIEPRTENREPNR